jgi:uncharacterized protein YfbU (UPF0304 family)
MARKSQRQVCHDRYVEQELKDILAMFRALQRAYDALPDKSGIEESHVEFRGFDANDHVEHEYLTVGIRFAEVDSEIKMFNSHFPRLRGYQMMLQEWRNSRDPDNLTKEDILRIFHAPSCVRSLRPRTKA